MYVLPTNTFETLRVVLHTVVDLLPVVVVVAGVVVADVDNVPLAVNQSHCWIAYYNMG